MQLVGTVFTQHQPHSVQEVSTASEEGLHMMFATRAHLVVTDGSDLRITLAGCVDIQKRELIDEPGPRLGDLETSCG